LAIPPAWKAVWICPRPDGHIQTTARDARGRKQYRYHERWREVRDRTKFGRMIELAQALPRIRRHVARDLRRPGLAARRSVLAAVDAAAERLGNTRVVCRASYVHPDVIDAFVEGRLQAPQGPRRAVSPRGLERLELATLQVLQAAARPRRRA
jgi:DNA topoisomerase IB